MRTAGNSSGIAAEARACSAVSLVSMIWAAYGAATAAAVALRCWNTTARPVATSVALKDSACR